MKQSETKTTAYDNDINRLVGCIREYQEKVNHLEADIYEAKVELRELLEERGANWTDEQGYARLMSEGTRITYDTSALDDLIINDPLRYGWLKDYRRESRVAGRVQVK